MEKLDIIINFVYKKIPVGHNGNKNALHTFTRSSLWGCGFVKQKYVLDCERIEPKTRSIINDYLSNVRSKGLLLLSIGV